MEVFKEFLAKIDDPAHRDRLEEILGWVHLEYPQLEPVVKWNQPMFTDHGTYIIGFSAAKHHLAVAPEKAGIDHFSSRIEKTGYTHTAQLMRIKWTEEVDRELLGAMIDFNIEEKKEMTAFWRG